MGQRGEGDPWQVIRTSGLRVAPVAQHNWCTAPGRLSRLECGDEPFAEFLSRLPSGV